MTRADTRLRRLLWTVFGIAAVVFIAVWAFRIIDRRTAEAADASTLATAADSVVTMAPVVEQREDIDETWPDSGPVTDAITLLTAKTPETLVGLPVYARGFTVQHVLDQNRFTVGPSPEKQAVVTLPRRDADSIRIRRGQVVNVRGIVERAGDGSLFIAAHGVEIPQG